MSRTQCSGGTSDEGSAREPEFRRTRGSSNRKRKDAAARCRPRFSMSIIVSTTTRISTLSQIRGGISLPDCEIAVHLK
jgi:hypothetical protein